MSDPATTKPADGPDEDPPSLGEPGVRAPAPRARRLAGRRRAAQRLDVIFDVKNGCHFWGKFCKFLAGSFSAVSKRNLQENMRLTAVFKLYKMCILLHRCKLNISAKNRFEKNSNFRENLTNVFAKSAKSCNILPTLKKFS